MPTVETPFIIAIIREKEKSLLDDDEITRIMHASSTHDVQEVLMSTPYAPYIANALSLSEGLTHALEAEFAWLSESLDNEKVLAFIGARYDVLHLAQSIIAYARKEPHVPELPRIGTLSHELLQEMLYNGHTPTKHTLFWTTVIAEHKAALDTNTWNMTFLFTSMQRVLQDRLRALATTQYMRALAEHTTSHLQSDFSLRETGYATMQDTTTYEWEWDAKAVSLINTQRYEPIGYDPIIAYWMTKEMEVKTIRLIIAALQGGFSKEETASLIRPFAHA